MNSRIRKKKAKKESIEFYKDTIWGKARDSGTRVYFYMPVDPFFCDTPTRVVCAHTCKPKHEQAHKRTMKYLIDTEQWRAKIYEPSGNPI